MSRHAGLSSASPASPRNCGRWKIERGKFGTAVGRHPKRGVWGEAGRVPPIDVTRHADEGGLGGSGTGPPNFMIVLAILIGLLAATTADAQLPKQVTLATNPPGTAYYAVASGLAKVVSSHAGYQMVVQPYTGTSTMLPLLNTGEVDFGLVNAVDLGLAYRGPSFKIGGRNPY